MELSVVTYNIHKGIGTDRVYKLERIIRVLRKLDPDIAALQEVPINFPKSGGENTAEIIAKELGMYYKIGLNVKKGEGEYGNATFSKFPISFSDNLNLTWSIKKKRGCLISRIEKKDEGFVWIMNFHLGLSGIERAKQIKKIINSDFFQNNFNSPMIILGDTNDSYNRLSPFIKRAGLKDTMSVSFRKNLLNRIDSLRGKIGSQGNQIMGRNTGLTRLIRKTGDTNAMSASPNVEREALLPSGLQTKRLADKRTFPAFAPVIRLDKVFFNHRLIPREHKVYRNALTRIASDHLPVYVRFEIPEPFDI